MADEMQGKTRSTITGLKETIKSLYNMRIYIASSWRNQHAIEMLTALLRDRGHEVISWVENNYGENHNHVTGKFDFETWVNSKESNQSFYFDTNGATRSDLVIYLSPSGKDAAAEVGAAWACNIPVLGLYSKGEDFGLMRKMIRRWFERYTDLLEYLEEFMAESSQPVFDKMQE
jgi:hypothetical protein